LSKAATVASKAGALGGDSKTVNSATDIGLGFAQLFNPKGAPVDNQIYELPVNKTVSLASSRNCKNGELIVQCNHRRNGEQGGANHSAPHLADGESLKRDEKILALIPCLLPLAGFSQIIFIDADSLRPVPDEMPLIAAPSARSSSMWPWSVLCRLEKRLLSKENCPAPTPSRGS